ARTHRQPPPCSVLVRKPEPQRVTRRSASSTLQASRSLRDRGSHELHDDDEPSPPKAISPLPPGAPLAFRVFLRTSEDSPVRTSCSATSPTTAACTRRIVMASPPPPSIVLPYESSPSFGWPCWSRTSRGFHSVTSRGSSEVWTAPNPANPPPVALEA